MVTEVDVEAFLSKLKTADADKKVDHVQFFGLQLEDTTELPESTLDPLILQLPTLLKSTSHLLIAATLTSLIPFFLPHLPADPPAPHLRLALLQVLPLLLEKLNDPKERVHSAAASALALLGKKCYEADPGALGTSSNKGKAREGLVEIWERGIKDILSGKGWRAKVEGMKVLLNMRADMGSKLPLKPWLPPLVGLLEDGDSNVREQAKESVVALLSPANTPPAARSELTKLLAARNVRKTISDSITARIFAGPTTSGVEDTGADDGASSTNGHRSGAATPAVDDVDPVYIAISRDVESEFAKMLPHFAGKENEHNWAPREKAIVRIRGMLRGKAFEKYPEAFVAGLKGGMMDGISRTLLSLRTTVAQQSCAVVQELAEHLKTALDPFVEHLLGVLGKMAGFTKKIIAEKSQKAVSAIIIHSSAQPRILISHISAGIHDKNVQTRHACAGHLKTYLDTHGANAKAQIDSAPGLEEQIEEALKKGLVDVNPQVRDLARSAFWSFHALWTSRATAVMNSMDSMARKQLDKSRTGSSNGLVPNAKPPAAPRASSAMSQLLAEKRKARAAELAAGKGQDTPRVVSSPVPASPSIPQGLPRSASSTDVANSVVPGPSSHSVHPSGESPAPSPTPVAVSSSASTRSIPARTRQGALSRAMSNSPPSSRGSPIGRASPLRSNHNITETITSPSSSSSTSGGPLLQTPTLSRKPLPTSLSRSPVGLGINGHSDSDQQLTPDQQRKIAEAEAAVKHLESLPISGESSQAPLTPVRPLGSSASASQLLRTPVNGRGRNIWDDSPRPEALTPLILDKLKERRHERSWWLKRQQLLDKASPLKSSSPSPASAIYDDLRALQEGTPDMRHLQKLALFSSSHPISIPSAAIEADDIAEERRIWEEDQLFEQLYNGLASFLQPTQSFDLLEQGLVILWELVQHQWSLFDEYSSGLCSVLFRLRTCRSSIILESTNSLISLLAEVSDPVFLFTELRTALDSYIQQHADESLSASTGELSLVSSTNSRKDDSGSSSVCTGEHARASGFLFGLNAMGMCILKMPREVVKNEAAHLGPLVMAAMMSPTTTTRQAANTLILAIQCVLRDAQATLALFSELNAGQKDLATYLMDKNGLLSPEDGAASGVMGEMTDLMARGSRIASS